MPPKFANNLIFDHLTWYKQSLQSQLKPCPFCGASDEQLAIHVPNEHNKEDITCLRCGATMEKALGVGVVRAWNCRSNRT